MAIPSSAHVSHAHAVAKAYSLQNTRTDALVESAVTLNLRNNSFNNTAERL